MYSNELENAIEALRKISSDTDMAVLADAFNRHRTYMGQQKARGLKIGDKIIWEYGGIEKVGIIKKMNRKTMEVNAVGNTPFGSTVTRIDKSMVKTKVVEEY